MLRLKYLLLILSIIGCGRPADKNSTGTVHTDSSAEALITQNIDSIPGPELEQLLNLSVKNSFNEIYSGQYSFTQSSDGVKILHDSFSFLYLDSGHYKDRHWIKWFEYTGQYNNGLKEGKFVEKLLLDDGIDRYSRWTITVNFMKDTCTSGSFNGQIGYMMPEKTYQIDAPEGCSFNYFSDYAWSEWEKEYEESKN